jgi:hypothetical protein
VVTTSTAVPRERLARHNRARLVHNRGDGVQHGERYGRLHLPSLGCSSPFPPRGDFSISCCHFATPAQSPTALLTHLQGDHSVDKRLAVYRQKIACKRANSILLYSGEVERLADELGDTTPAVPSYRCATFWCGFWSRPLVDHGDGQWTLGWLGSFYFSVCDAVWGGRVGARGQDSGGGHGW